MKKILFINACIRPQSRTYELAQLVLSRMDGEVEEVNLEHENIQPLNSQTLQRRQLLLAQGSFDAPMLHYARQFKQADIIVIAAPYYDYSFPASLKVYLESIAAVGLTFYYDENENPQTLCRGTRLFYVTTSGGEYIPDFSYNYVKAMFESFYHISLAQCFYAEKLDLLDSDADVIMEKTRQRIIQTLER